MFLKPLYHRHSKKQTKLIPVTKTFFPPISRLNAYLRRVYESGWMTNRGELVLELEEKLKQYLGVPELLITNNGTIPLQMALKCLENPNNDGEIITTPFSYVATTSSIVWEGFKPVFVDIDPVYFTIDEKQIEQAITPKTRAILATHVFGNPCNVAEIEKIAQKHNLKVVYDGAHCFGVKYNGTSIFNYGDVSTCSFHATKLFHTAEGGAIFTQNPDLFHKLFYSHNFGHNGPLEFHGLGVNGKISELQAAMGLAVFECMNEIIQGRKAACEWYWENLSDANIQTLALRPGTEWNYSYFPVVFMDEKTMLAVQHRLNSMDIFPRRYFYPSLNNLPYLQPITMPVSDSIAARILCLPLYHNVEKETILKITKTIHG